MFQNVAGEGEISRAEVSGDGGRTFLNMEHSWGAVSHDYSQFIALLSILYSKLVSLFPELGI